MNKEIEQVQRKILGMRQVFNTYHDPVLHKNDGDTLFTEIDRLQAEIIHLHERLKMAYHLKIEHSNDSLYELLKTEYDRIAVEDKP